MARSLEAGHLVSIPEARTMCDALVATRPGELWHLGQHRLLCGDSSKPHDVDRLLDGAAVHLVHTDPPYNVKVEPRSNNAIAAGLSSFQGTRHHQAGDLTPRSAASTLSLPRIPRK